MGFMSDISNVLNFVHNTNKNYGSDVMTVVTILVRVSIIITMMVKIIEIKY